MKAKNKKGSTILFTNPHSVLYQAHPIHRAIGMLTLILSCSFQVTLGQSCDNDDCSSWDAVRITSRETGNTLYYPATIGVGTCSNTHRANHFFFTATSTGVTISYSRQNPTNVTTGSISVWQLNSGFCHVPIFCNSFNPSMTPSLNLNVSPLTPNTDHVIRAGYHDGCMHHDPPWNPCPDARQVTYSICITPLATFSDKDILSPGSAPQRRGWLISYTGPGAIFHVWSDRQRTLEIADILGRMVSIITIKEGENSVSLEDLLSGAYIVRDPQTNDYQKCSLAYKW